MIQRLAASLYEPLLGTLLAPMRQSVLSLAQSLPRPPTYTVLDCCCGAGGLLKLLEQATHTSPPQTSHALHVGLDLCDNMLHAAKMHTRKATRPIRFIRGNGTRLPFADKNLFLVTTCMALHTVKHKVALDMLQEIQRVAQYAIIADYCLIERNMYAPARILSTLLEKLAGTSHYANYKVFMQRGAIEGLLHTARCRVHKRHTVLGGVGRVTLITC